MHARCRNGLGYVTEERSVIMDMSVADNLKLAAVPPDGRVRATSRRSRRSWTAAPGSARAASSRCCRWPGPSVATRRCCWPTSCRSGWRRSSSPTSSQAVRAAADERGVGVLLVEQHVRQALKIADRVYVMERGRIVLSGTSDEVVGQLDKIEAAYLAGGG